MEWPMEWSARQYAKFEDERTRPVRDLLAAVPTDGFAAPVRRAADLGCGPGSSTEALAARFPGAEDWDDPGPWDLILANAVLHWLPDHATLLPRLAGKLAPGGGSLAVQMPDNLDEPAHRLMRAVAAEGPWAGKLADAAEAARTALGTPAWYYGLLRPVCARVDVWRTTYHHALPGGAAAIVEWFKGSGLRPYLAPLDEAERAEFLARYEAAIARAYPAALADGTVLLPFPRLFLVATR